MNLLSNAVKFSKPKDTVTVRYSVLEDAPDGEQILISVRDKGIGMSENELQNLFTPFYRSQNEES